MAKVKSWKKSSGYIFRLFPKDFIKPYGAATVEIGKEKMKTTLQAFTCELLRRPATGVSQFAQTVNENQKRLKEQLSKRFQPTQLEAYMATLTYIMEACQHLNMMERQDKTKIHRNLKKLMNIVQRQDKQVDDKSWKRVIKYMHLGASMYLVGIHLLALRTWATHPNWVAKRAQKGTIFDKPFKKWCNSHKPQMHKLIAVVEAGLKTNKSKDVSFLSEEETSADADDTSSSAESVNVTPAKKRNVSRRSKSFRRPLYSNSHSPDSDANAKKTKHNRHSTPSKKKRHCPSPSLSSSDSAPEEENFEQTPVLPSTSAAREDQHHQVPTGKQRKKKANIKPPTSRTTSSKKGSLLVQSSTASSPVDTDDELNKAPFVACSQQQVNTGDKTKQKKKKVKNTASTTDVSNQINAPVDDLVGSKLSIFFCHFCSKKF